MNDEEAFQAALDANPEDHTTRLVFADWLEERGDPRAEGYRALGVAGFFTHEVTPGKWTWFTIRSYRTKRSLPKDWYDALEGGKGTVIAGERVWVDYDSRRAADDAAAIAYAKLPPQRRAKLLAGTPEAKT